jgi:hypothetical protein
MKLFHEDVPMDAIRASFARKEAILRASEVRPMKLSLLMEKQNIVP